MAEALAVGASVIAVAQAAERIASLCKFYIENLQGCPQDIRVILIETSTVKVLFDSLELFRKHDPTVLSFLSKLSGPNGPIAGCLESITKLEELLPSEYLQPPTQQGSGGRRKRKDNITLS